MAEKYVEPTNEQLANFLVIYATMIPEMSKLNLSPPILESLLSQNPNFRQGALRHHRHFQERADKMAKLMQEGKLPCSHIRPNGKQCPNFNEPGSYYCGLHKEENA